MFVFVTRKIFITYLWQVNTSLAKILKVLILDILDSNTMTPFTLAVQVRCMSKTLACHHQCEHTFFPSTHTRILAHSHAWVQSLNLVLNTKWYLGLQSTTVSECSTSLCQWPGTNAWGLSVNTDIRGGENGGLNKLLYDATPNSDTYHFRFRCEEKSSCSVEWEIHRSHGSFLNSFFNLFT